MEAMARNGEMEAMARNGSVEEFYIGAVWTALRCVTLAGASTNWRPIGSPPWRPPAEIAPEQEPVAVCTALKPVVNPSNVWR
jgi:hypothetical protein